MKFEEKLVLLRKKNGLSQEALAETLEVSRQAISRWESGSTMPDAPNLVKLGNLFQVSTDYLLHDDYCSDGDIPVVKEAKAAAEKQAERENRRTLITAVIWYVGSACFLLAAWIGSSIAFAAAGLLYLISASGFLAKYLNGRATAKSKE